MNWNTTKLLLKETTELTYILTLWLHMIAYIGSLIKTRAWYFSIYDNRKLRNTRTPQVSTYLDMWLRNEVLLPLSQKFLRQEYVWSVKAFSRGQQLVKHQNFSNKCCFATRNHFFSNSFKGTMYKLIYSFSIIFAIKNDTKYPKTGNM